MTTTTAVTHWHVATGLAGYGPDGSDGYGTATDMPTLADLIRSELRDASSAEDETSRSIAEAGDYEDAWKIKTRSEELDTLAANFDNKRADAPLYAGRPDLWAETVQRLAVEKFPLDISYNTRLYVWPCEESGCEHLADYLAD
ncbi:hypothetical protein [Micromonospora maritima]|uniref:hypothetical protein n=1 Tax=Micromonospora maritima TaxID=986711 RepID=UPI00157D6E69|nr:hypothetical protein [Micromonospora maritima]